MYATVIRSCVVFLTCAALGCSPSVDATSISGFDQASFLIIDGSELQRFVRESDIPVLVEFGVDYNCPRCQQVKSDVQAMSERLDQSVKMVRIDYNSNSNLAAQRGGTICPTYVLFVNDEPVLTRSFPISIDLLESEVISATEDR